MKILLAAVIPLFLMLPISALSGEVDNNYSNGLPNGRFWSNLNQQEKESMVFGLLLGYEWGYADGVVSVSATAASPPPMPMFFIKPEHYVNKIDAFYRAYPLCKKKDLLNMFGNLLSFWHKDILKKSNSKTGDITLGRIGETCRAEK